MHTKQIIACVDQSGYANAVADCAAWVSRQVDAPIEFLHAIDRHLEQGSGEDHSGAIGFDAQEALLNKLLEEDSKKTRQAREHGRLFLNGLKERLSSQTQNQVDTRLRHGSLVETLKEREENARVVVMGRKGETSLNSQRDIGRTFEAAVRAINKPVLGVQAEFAPPKRILFAFDGSAVSKRGIQTVLESKLFKGMTGVLLMCGPGSKGAEKLLKDSAAGLSHAGIPTEFDQVSGEVVEQVIAGIQKHDADLLVIGAYTHSVIRNFIFGSKTSDILRATSVPALLLR